MLLILSIAAVVQVVVLGVMVFFSYFFFIYMMKVNDMGVSSQTMGFKMVIPMALVFVGCCLITLHTIFNILLPREYWFGADKPAASEKEEEED